MHGNSPSGSAPESVYLSVWQIPVALISTNTSPALGPASCTVSIVSGWPASKAIAARTSISVLLGNTCSTACCRCLENQGKCPPLNGQSSLPRIEVDGRRSLQAIPTKRRGQTAQNYDSRCAEIPAAARASRLARDLERFKGHIDLFFSSLADIWRAL